MATHLSSLAWAIPWPEDHSITKSQSRLKQLMRMYTREWNEATITLAPCMYIYLFMYIYIFTTPYNEPPGNPMHDMLLISGCLQEFSIIFYFQLFDYDVFRRNSHFILFEVYWASCIYKYIFSPNLGYFKCEFFTYFVSTLVSFLLLLVLQQER